MNTDYLKGWDPENEQAKADFIEYLYRRSGRTSGLYTGLWEEFKCHAADSARKQVCFLGKSINDVLWGSCV